MVAYFSSRFTKQIQTALTAALLVFCLLGTHWIGLSHSISHAGIQGQSLEASKSTIADKSFSHSSDICHLFDALSLAGFITSDQSKADLIHQSTIDQKNTNNPFLRNAIGSDYQSRAPPTFIL
ncbi:hypothetical protein [Polynucleobacter sp. JS-Polo-80-F4]|uniref:hypothetical protein n=1 Tax=Polynucleobacter sp. JS-Polo-80-F4 TaxID=2576918 RepID=UPI001C0BB6B7|nr:hypothetical protein [Polynucleobacter sp. JS-Polo-80-F4]MBU3617470.1 hypothetical protein [Polynucleobacter sp. JS-Polo-80-F4]